MLFSYSRFLFPHKFEPLFKDSARVPEVVAVGSKKRTESATTLGRRMAAATVWDPAFATNRAILRNVRKTRETFGKSSVPNLTTIQRAYLAYQTTSNGCRNMAVSLPFFLFFCVKFPYFSSFLVSNDDRCNLYCRATNTNSYFSLRDKVIDGTSCSPDSFDVCVNGQCTPAGCDHILHSGIYLGEPIAKNRLIFLDVYVIRSGIMFIFDPVSELFLAGRVSDI